jgi:prevent-host-death family protein
MFNMHQAKTQLSRLVAQAAKGEAFIIAKAGKPLVKVVPLDSSGTRSTSRLGFFEGKIKIPEDFDSVGREEIAQLFEGKK